MVHSNNIILATSSSDNAASDKVAAAVFDERNKLIRSKAAQSIKEDSEYPFYKDGESQTYFYSDRVLFSDKHTTSVIKYPHIIKAYENEEYFFLYVTERKIFAVLKKGFLRQGDAESVKKLLQLNLKERFMKA